MFLLEEKKLFNNKKRKLLLEIKFIDFEINFNFADYKLSVNNLAVDVTIKPIYLTQL